MLTHDRLLELHRELGGTPALSVYVDGNQHDPAERQKWRLQLEHGLAEAGGTLVDREREAFAVAEQFVLDHLKGFDAFLPDKSYVAFATAERLCYGQTLSVSMPHLAHWGKGIVVAPYVRGLKQERPVVVALIDSERGRVFVYRDGAVRETDDTRADTFAGDLTDVGISKRGAVTSGTRGETATDAGQRHHEVASERMLKELASVVAQRAGDQGFVVIGGTVEMEKRLRKALPKSLEGRVMVEPALQVEMTEGEVRKSVGDSASELTKRWQMEQIGFVFDQARASQRGSIGYAETARALEELRVDTLFLSRDRTRDPVDAERLIALAFSGRAHVEEVSGPAGALLDREAEGIAARLRFRPSGPGTGHRDGEEPAERQVRQGRRESARSE